MVLAIDIGNSNIVIGCFEGSKIMFIERLSTNVKSTSMEYTTTIKTVLDLNGVEIKSLEGSIICSVVPSLTQTLKEAVVRLTRKDPLIVGPGIKTGIKITLDNPVELGSDRVADAVAACEYYPTPLIMVDMGTATTISVIGEDKAFLGGLILPGLRVSLDSLSNRASQLPVIGLEPPKKVIGTNTVDCMKSGVIYGAAASIDGIVDRIEKEIGKKCTVISTGGLSGNVIPYCKREIIMDEQLMLKGLVLLYQKNV